MRFNFILSIVFITNTLCIGLLFSISPVYAAVNDYEFIRDGGFEVGIFDLDIVRFPRYGSTNNIKIPYLDSVSSIKGRYSLRLPSLDKKSGYRIIYKAYPLVFGKKYRLSFRAKSLTDVSTLNVEIYQGWSILKKKTIKVNKDEKLITLEFTARDTPKINTSEVMHFFRIWVNGKSDLLIDSVSLIGPAPNTFVDQQPVFDITMNKMPAVYVMDENSEAKIVVPDNLCKACSIKYNITDPFSHQILLSGEFNIDNQSKITQYELILDTNNRGYYQLNVKLLDGNGVLIQQQNKPYVTIDPVTPEPNMRRPFGMAFEEHFRKTQNDAFVNVEDYYQIAKMIGVGTGRIFSLAMPDILSKDGINFDFTQLDSALTLFEKYEIEPLIVLGSNMPGTVPKWMRECDKKESDTIDLLAGLTVNAHRERFERTINDGRFLCLSKYKNYLNSLLTHINGRVQYLEVWNEPGFKFRPDDYLKIVEATRKTINKVDSDIKLLGFSSTVWNDLGRGADPSYSPTFLKEMVDREAVNLIDILSLHSEHAFLFMSKSPDYRDQRTNFVQRMKFVLESNNISLKPIWDTERGVPWSSKDGRKDFMEGKKFWKHSRKSESMLNVAKKIPMIYSEAFSSGIERLIWFNFESSIEVIQRSKYRKGFFDSGSQPGPQIPVYDAMTQLLSGAKFLKFISNDDGDRIYIFENLKNLIVLGYNWKKKVVNRLTLKNIDKTDYKVLNIMGNIIKPDSDTVLEDVKVIKPTPKYWVLPKIKINTIGFEGV